jgi:phage repressor protein C with HTH and peptisase S24 domain
MEPTIPDGAIVIIDRDQWQPTGNRRSIWAIRMDNNGDLGIKRLQASEGGLIIISDNFQNYPPSLAWSTDLTKLVIGKVVWMWRSL